MNFLKNTLAFAVLFAINSANARTLGTKPSTPAAKSAAIEPAAQAKSYKQLHDEVLKMYQNNVFDIKTGEFKESFITRIKTDIGKNELADLQLEGLLQTARDKFAPFTGNNDNDLALLQKINLAINDMLE